MFTKIAYRFRSWTRIASQSAFCIVTSTSSSRSGSNQSASGSAGSAAAGQTGSMPGASPPVARKVTDASATLHAPSFTTPHFAGASTSAICAESFSRKRWRSAASTSPSSSTSPHSQASPIPFAPPGATPPESAWPALGSPGQLSSQPAVAPPLHGASPAIPERSPSSAIPSVSRSGIARPSRSADRSCTTCPPLQALGAPNVLVVPSLYDCEQRSTSALGRGLELEHLAAVDTDRWRVAARCPDPARAPRPRARTRARPTRFGS